VCLCAKLQAADSSAVVAAGSEGGNGGGNWEGGGGKKLILPELNLRYLDLSANHIEDSGAKTLAEVCLQKYIQTDAHTYRTKITYFHTN